MDLEYKTIAAMIRIYCKSSHSREKGLCDRLAYARERIDQCPFGADKPVCNNCTVHCYKPDMREQAREVMRFSGPRMLARHPLLAIRHLVRSKRYLGKRSK